MVWDAYHQLNLVVVTQELEISVLILQAMGLNAILILLTQQMFVEIKHVRTIPQQQLINYVESFYQDALVKDLDVLKPLLHVQIFSVIKLNVEDILD